MRYKIEVKELKNGYKEAQLIDTNTNNHVEFRICDTDAYLKSQIADWTKRFNLGEEIAVQEIENKRKKRRGIRVA